MHADYQTQGNTHIVYDADLLGQLEEGFCSIPYWHSRVSKAESSRGKGSTSFIRDGEREYVLRHYYRGGFPASFSKDRYFWTGLKSSRAWQEWHLLAEMVRLGLPVPIPAAARVERQGLFYTADLVTVRLPGNPLSYWAEQGALDLKVWRAVGRCIHRFHQARVYHADLNAHNIFLDADGNVSLLDFDRGHFKKKEGVWKEKNMVRLRRSLEKLKGKNSDFSYTEATWEAVRTGYAEPSG